MSTLVSYLPLIANSILSEAIMLKEFKNNHPYLIKDKEGDLYLIIRIGKQIDGIKKHSLIKGIIDVEPEVARNSFDDPDSLTMNNPQLEAKILEDELDLSNFPTIKLIYQENPEHDSKSKVILKGNFDVSFTITQVQSSFLDFLIQEKLNKVENETPWLSEINKRTKYIENIIKRYELPSNYDNVIDDQDGRDGETTWINDHRNSYRKTIVSEINNRLKYKYDNVKGKLITLKKIQFKTGNYILEKHLKEASVEKGN